MLLSIYSAPFILVCLAVYEGDFSCYFAINMLCLHVKIGFLPGWSAAVPRAHAGVCRFDDGERAQTPAAFRRTGYTTGVVTWTRTFCK